MTQKRKDTPILNELEQAQVDEVQADQLLHAMAEKVQFYTMLVAHLLMRLEAVTPDAHVKVTTRHQKLATGLPLMIAAVPDDPDAIAIFVQCDKESVEYIRKDETQRRKDNGIGIEVVVRVGRAEPKSGLIGLDGKELPTAERRPVPDAGVTGPAGEVS